MNPQITLLANETTGAIHNPTQEDKMAVQQILQYHVKGFENMPLFEQGRWDGTSTFFKWSNATFPAGFLAYTAASLKQRGYDVRIVRKPLPVPLGPSRPKVGTYAPDPRYEYQYDTVDRLLKYGGMVAQCATGCHAKGTKVLMFDGTFKKIENIVVGDLLMGPDSTSRTVLRLCRGRDIMYRITPMSGGNSFVVNGDHILSLKQTNGCVCNVSVRDYLNWDATQKRIHKLYRSEGIDFKNETQITLDPYMLGTRDDNGFIPDAYKCGSREVRLQVLAGLIDTNGSIDRNGFDYIAKSKQLSEDVTFIARSVGLTVNKAVKATEKNFQLSISGNTEIIPSRVVRKCAEPRKQIEAPCTTDFSVEKLGDDNYYGFHLNGDHLYMLEDFTVTHNSGKSVAAELAFARINRPTLFITTRALLMYQMKRNFERDLSLPVSVIGDGEFGLEGGSTKLGMFTVAMVQTLQARLKGPDPKDKEPVRSQKLAIQKATKELLAKFEFIVLEEAHESAASGYFEICNACKRAAYRLALTATPFMKDDEEANMRLMAVSGPIGIRVTEKMLIDRGILAKPYFKYIKLTHKPKYLTKRTDWQAAYRIGIVENEERNELIIQEALQARKHGLSVMCLVLHKNHGKLLMKKMKDAGLKAAFIFGENNAEERQTKLQELASGEIDVLIGSTILDVGVDVPAVGMVILAGAGRAEVALRQRIGRGLRAKKKGPNVCFIVDIDDDFNNHLINHAAQRRAIVLNTPGFNEGVVDEFPYHLFEEEK